MENKTIRYAIRMQQQRGGWKTKKGREKKIDSNTHVVSISGGNKIDISFGTIWPPCAFRWPCPGGLVSAFFPISHRRPPIGHLVHVGKRSKRKENSEISQIKTNSHWENRAPFCGFSACDFAVIPSKRKQNRNTWVIRNLFHSMRIAMASRVYIP